LPLSLVDLITYKVAPQRYLIKVEGLAKVYKNRLITGMGNLNNVFLVGFKEQRER